MRHVQATRDLITEVEDTLATMEIKDSEVLYAMELRLRCKELEVALQTQQALESIDSSIQRGFSFVNR